MKADLTALSKDQERKLQKHLEAIDEAKLNIVNSAVSIGAELIGIREILQHGQFLPWIEDRCGYTKSTAYRYIRAAEQFGNFPKLGSFDDSALYVLSPCEEAVKKAKALAHRGKFVTHELAKEIVAEVKASKSTERTAAAPPAPEPDDDKPADDCAAAAFTCPNCGGTEADEDGDCAKCHEPPREPGDDTEAIQSEAAKRKASGKEKVPPKMRKEAMRALGVVVRFIDKLGQHDAARPHLEVITAIVKGTA